MSRAAALLHLQALDLELETIRQRLVAIEAALGDNPRVREAQRLKAEAQADLHRARVALQNLEFDNQALSDKIAEVSERMYGGAVSHPKQLQDLQMDLESLKRRRAALEDEQFAALVAAEEAEARFASLQSALQQMEAEAARTHGDLLDERQRLQAALARLELGREATVASIPAVDRELYDRLRPGKKGRPVTRLEEGVCISCGVAPSSSRVQSARQGNELILCGNCGRILCAD